MFDIVTAGSITLDTFIEPQEVHNFEKNNTDFFGFEVGGKIKMKTKAKHVGGGAANSAVGFTKMGLKTAALGTLGQDEHADYILHRLQQKNVDTQFIHWQKNHPSSASIIFNLPDGRRTVFHERTTALPFKRIPETKAIYVGHLAEAEENLFAQIDIWKTESKIFAWNPGKTQFKKGFNFYENVAKKCDILILNKEEAELFTGIIAPIVDGNLFSKKAICNSENTQEKIFDATQLGKKFLTAGIKQIIITDGKKGAQYFSQEHSSGLFVPQIDMQKPVSTLGAGDSFSVGAVSAFMQKKSPQDMLLSGSLNAGSVVQFFGAQNGLLSKNELEEKLKLI